MKKFVILGLFSAFVLEAAFAVDCTYCQRMDTLKAGFSRVVPDSMNNETIDRQNELVDGTTDLVLEVVRSSSRLPQADLERIVGLLAIAAPYDYENSMSERILVVLKPQIESFFSEITRQLKAGKLTAKQADDLRISMGTAEQVQMQGGTDPFAPAIDEVSDQKKK